MNMKPSWDDAPEWAQWLAMDESGRWWWYEFKPVCKEEYWLGDDFGNGDMEEALPNTSFWDKSLEKRKSQEPINIDRIANDFRDRVIIGYEDAETIRIEAEAFARKVAALVEALHDLDDERVTAVLTAYEVSI